MDKLVRRVTRVERGAAHANAKIIYKSDEDKDGGDDEATPHFHKFEQSIRHMLKAQLIAAQEAYQRHVESAEKGGNTWLHDGPRNFMKARRKALKEMRKASPFASTQVDAEEDEE
jgi:hypothetical protein